MVLSSNCMRILEEKEFDLCEDFMMLQKNLARVDAFKLKTFKSEARKEENDLEKGARPSNEE